MRHLYCCCLLAVTPALGAQGPTFTSSLTPLVRLQATEVPRLVEQWSSSAIGGLFQEEDARRAGALAVQFHASRNRRRIATELALQALDTSSAPPHVLAQAYAMSSQEPWRLLEMPIGQVASAELTWLLHDDEDRNITPFFVRAMSSLPRFEGQWAQRFEAEARARATSRLLRRVEDAKISGFPAHVFATPELAPVDGLASLPQQRWMLHLPGRFLYGNGVPAEVGAVDVVAAPEEAAVSLEVFFDAWNRQLAADGFSAPAEAKLLGLDAVRRFRWSARFADGLIYDVAQLELNGAPSGILAALATDAGAPPPQRLPAGALAQLRVRLDPATAYDALVGADDDFTLSAARHDALLAALGGGFALGCCAPAPGSLIPRTYLTLEIGDHAQVAQLLADVTDGLPIKRVRYGNVDVQVLKIDGAPPGLQPAFCVLGGQLHVAESALSMRAFLEAQAGEAVAMDVDGAAPPAGAGDVIPGFDLRFDAAEIYRSFYDHWLPLFELSSAAELPTAVTRDDLPEPAVVAEHLGKGRGVLRRGQDTISLVQASASGGLEMTALLFAWPTMLAQQMFDFTEEETHLAVAKPRLAAAHDALQRFQAREQRLPEDLAELFIAERLPDDALLLPADDLAEEVLLPDGRVVRSSFRFFPEPVQMPAGGAGGRIFAVGGANGRAAKQAPAVLVELRPHPFQRAALLIDGVVPDFYGSYAARAPIQAFK